MGDGDVMADRPIIGVDEAGRGPVLGPLVLGIVWWDDPRMPGDLELRDSKQMTESQRELAREHLSETVDYRVLMIPPRVIDRSDYSLPALEARVLVQALGTLPVADVVSDRLSAGEAIHQYVREETPTGQECRFETGADDRYPAVSAASVFAKVARDRAMESLGQRWGKIGSGYPSDPRTRQWLRTCWKDRRWWPPLVRTGWSTVRSIRSELDQGELFTQSP